MIILYHQANLVTTVAQEGRGKPDWMSFLPHLYGAENYQVAVHSDEFEFDQTAMRPSHVTDVFNELATCVMNEFGWQASNIKDALDLYIKLIKTIQDLP